MTTVTTSTPSTSTAWPNINGLAIPVTGVEPVAGVLQPPPGFTPLLTPVPGFWESPSPSGLLASSPVLATNPISPPETAASRLGEQFLDNPAEASRPEKVPAATAKAVLAKTGAIPKRRCQAKQKARPATPEMTMSQESTSEDSGSETSGDSSSSCLSAFDVEDVATSKEGVSAKVRAPSITVAASEISISKVTPQPEEIITPPMALSGLASDNLSSTLSRASPPDSSSKEAGTEAVLKTTRRVNLVQLAPVPLMVVPVTMSEFPSGALDALIDSGAEVNLLSSRVVQDYQLQMVPNTISLKGLGQTQPKTLGPVLLTPTVYCME
ncbi:uncharacterized protein [Palaemon carinicauda]|uniref:uncharacterized protein n=1 Tax=Palaemon carinicauda TaxID=392227 RepID=UPI0035B5AEC6